MNVNAISRVVVNFIKELIVLTKTHTIPILAQQLHPQTPQIYLRHFQKPGEFPQNSQANVLSQRRQTLENSAVLAHGKTLRFYRNKDPKRAFTAIINLMRTKTVAEI